MKPDELHNKLIAAARSIAPDERVPYAFEQRIMARLVSAMRIDPWAVWSRALWRGAMSCVAIMALCGAWTLWAHRSPANADFSQEFESAVFASANTDLAW